ncbi:Cupredoxin superfamily protein [Gossypium australe]|uniref:Cupredoxin superfamily protein n=1 Tax=Gossypium australe TaxID=47621 RepID=A0A5B6UZY4_9ROSI|nr:Cupredoxin superfamily protein [Gossypium australe]
MMRIMGLFSAIVPEGVTEPFNYDADHGIILSDWYHHSAYDQSTALSSIPFQWIGEPQSLLINGKGNYDCSGLAPGICNSTNPQCSPSTLTDHEMTIIEADGQYVEPFVTKNLFIYSGETYSVLVSANQDPSKNY